jgi:hypothetical protein
MQAFRVAVAAVLVGVWLPLARADDIPWGLNPALNDEFFGLGPSTFETSTGAANSQSGVGTVVDFQNTLGMPIQRGPRR